MLQTNVRSIAEQLSYIYFAEEWWMKHKMSPEEAYQYHLSQLEKGAIQVVEELGVVLGYWQVWRLTNEQVNRIISKLPFNENNEDITHGPVAMLQNLYIDKSFRGGRVFKQLHKMFKDYTKDCDSVVGVEQKYRERVKLFKLKG
jgi:hypothetical protein